MSQTDAFPTPADFPHREPLPATTELPGSPRIGPRWRKPRFVRLLAFAVVVLIWQYVALVNRDVPDVVQVLDFLAVEMTGGSHGGALNGEFWGPLAESLQRYGIGLAVGIPAGIALGLVIGASRVARDLLNDTTVALVAFPSVVWAFLASLWFGFTSEGPIMAVILTVAPFAAVNVSAGVRGIDRSLADMSRSYRVPWYRRSRHMLLAGTLPAACTGIRLAFTAGWNSLLIAEWFSATSGVGWRARFWYDALRYPGFVAWVLLYVVVILVLDRIMLRPLERRAFRWSERPVLTFSG